MNAIEIQGVTRIYKAAIGVLSHKTKEVVALDGIDFNVKQGELFGLLGPNGSGKTTTVKILTTLLTPSKGSATVLGHDVVNEVKYIRSRIGFVFGGERGLYWRLSGYDNLVYFANLYNVPRSIQKSRIPELLDLVGLDGRGDEKVQGYSRGMKQRLHIARALIHDPEILFLDEPTIGLDPVGARELRNTIQSLQERKTTILLTTHYMNEADYLCDRIAILNKGKIVTLDTPVGLKKHVQDLSVIRIEVDDFSPELNARFKNLADVELLSYKKCEQSMNYLIQCHAQNGSSVIAAIVTILKGIGLEVGNINIHEPTLEDAYVKLVGEKA